MLFTLKIKRRFYKKIAKKIAKMIAAHHGRADWGAIVDLDTKDLEPIYYLIHHIDDMSAKYGMTNVAMLG